MRPKGLNSKIRFRMAYDRREHLRIFASKIESKKFIAQRVGVAYLPTLYQVCQNPRDIAWKSLPDSFVAKASWRSGGTVICLPSNSFDGKVRFDSQFPRLITSKNNMTQEQLTSFFMKLDFDYLWQPGRFPEWAYGGAPRFVLIEEFLGNREGRIPRDYKFFCFSGKVNFIQVDFPLEPFRDIYTRDWVKLPVRITYKNSQSKLTPPANLPKMLHLAEILSQGWDFLRVDMYNVDGRIVAGELTCYPEGGTGKIRPRSFDRRWGELWDVTGEPHLAEMAS